MTLNANDIRDAQVPMDVVYRTYIEQRQLAYVEYRAAGSDEEAATIRDAQLTAIEAMLTTLELYVWGETTAPIARTPVTTETDVTKDITKHLKEVHK